jgi:hypothetical protein
MALLRRACLGWERVAADRARRTTVRAVSTARGRRVCVAVGWGAWGAAAAARHRPLGELLCGGGGGPCRGCMVGLAAVVRRSPHEDDPAGPARTKGREQRLDVDRGLFGPSITFSLVALFVSCDDGDGDEVGHEPVFLLLAGGGAGVGQADGSVRDVADDVRLDPWRLSRCLARLLLDHPHLHPHLHLCGKSGPVF